MVLSWIILFIFNCFCAINRHKAILLLFPFALLFTTIPLLEGSHDLLLFSGLLFSGFVWGVIDGKTKNNKKNPFFLIIIVNLVVTFLVGLFNYSGFKPSYIIIESTQFLFLIILWNSLNTKDDVNKILHYFSVLSVIVFVVAITELLLQKNLWFEFFQPFFKKVIFHSRIEDIRFGFGRYNSVFDFCVSMGDFFAVMAATFLFLNSNSQKRNNHVFSYRTLLFICILGVLLSNSRACLVALLIGLLQFKGLKKNLLLYLITGIVAGGFILSSLQSIFDTDVNYGSSFEMREAQLQLVLLETAKHPVFGDLTAVNELQFIDSDAFGLESVIFTKLLNSGIVGFLTYVFTYVSMFLVFPKKNKHFPFLLSTLWVTAAVMSLTTGLSIVFPIVILMILYKLYLLNLVKIKETKHEGRNFNISGIT